jgi:hypothetical protein
MKSEVMHWTTVPFGRYKGKTLPEIIVQDLDWFFWALPKLYGRLADEAQDLARKVRGINFRNQIKAGSRSNIALKWTAGSAAFRSSTLIVVNIPDGRAGCRTWTCCGRFAENTTSEQAAS